MNEYCLYLKIHHEGEQISRIILYRPEAFDSKKTVVTLIINELNKLFIEKDVPVGFELTWPDENEVSHE